jgi:thioredoxin
MPAIIDPNRCNRAFEACFPARICPAQAFSVDPDGVVVIDFARCGDCPGPCVNFCDGYAISYDRDPETFDLLRQQLAGEMTDKEAVEARLALLERRQQEAEEKTSVSIINATEASFAADVLQAEEPVVVDFWAEWCGPCKQMAPVFEKLAVEYAGRARFVKVDTDQEPGLAAACRITSLPTVMVFFQGQVIEGTVGALPEGQLRSLIDRVLRQVAALTPTRSQDGSS